MGSQKSQVRSGRSRSNCDDTDSVYQGGQLELQDLNGDGSAEAWIRESSSNCFGLTGESFVLLTKKGGVWTPVLDQVGIASTRKAKHLGWPDIEVGGPGMGPFPVFRYNGTRYVSR